MPNSIHKSIKKVYIKGFKVFEDIELEFKNLTVLTGENSSGKSSLIQAILFLGNPIGLIGTNFNKDLHEYLRSLGNSELFNKNGAREIEIEIDNLKLKWLKKEQSTQQQIGDFSYPNFLSYPENLIYLNAEKHRIQQVSQLIENLQDRFFGIYGDLVSNYFYHNKRKTVEEYLIKETSSVTLEAQINYWLSYITGIDDLNIEINKITPTLVKNVFKINNDEFIPENLGTGLSHIFSILVMCISAKKGNIVIIENPEIHLHPKSQAKLGEFLAFIASKGIQIIIETHNDHIINRFRYEVYQGDLKSDDVVIYYKEIDKPFEKIETKDNGKFYDKNGENSFPSGFYDATLKEIFKINKGK
jgi:predicted ATPase